MKNKILLLSLLTSCLSLAAITGPKVEVGANIGVGTEVQSQVEAGLVWNSKVANKVDIDFGPKAFVAAGYNFKENKIWKKGAYFKSGATISFDANIDVNSPKYKPYVGLETGFGIGTLFSTSGNTTSAKATFDVVGNVHGGVKINEKTKIGLAVGYGKGQVALEFSYKF